jgi:hypothetical protein
MNRQGRASQTRLQRVLPTSWAPCRRSIKRCLIRLSESPVNVGSRCCGSIAPVTPGESLSVGTRRHADGASDEELLVMHIFNHRVHREHGEERRTMKR